MEDHLPPSAWAAPDWNAQPNGAKPKMAMALRLRKETTLTLKWIAIRLPMGSWS